MVFSIKLCFDEAYVSRLCGQAHLLGQLNLTNLPIYAKNNNLPLSSREIDCLKNILKGLSAKESAGALNLSPRTVESYLYNIKNKFGLHKKSDLVSLAMSL